MKYLRYTTQFDGCEGLLPFTENTLRGLPLYADIAAGLCDMNGVTVGRSDSGEIKAIIYHNTMEYILVWHDENTAVERVSGLPDFDEGGYATMKYEGEIPVPAPGVYKTESLDGITQCVELAFSDESDKDETEGALYKIVKRVVADCADVFCMLDGGRVVSTAMIIAKNKGYAIIGNIYTLPEYRSRGLAGKLLATSVAHSMKAGLTPILYCEDELVPYYLKRGFVLTDGM